MASSDVHVCRPCLEINKTVQEVVNLNPGVQYNLTDMAVTSNNKLLLCNFQPSCPMVYIYDGATYMYVAEISFSSPPWCITVVPCRPNTVKAVVTLPYEESIQFINTTNNTKEQQISIGEWCHGVTAVKDKIYIGGYGQVLIRNADGSRVREIIAGGANYYLLYNESHDQLLVRQYILLRDETNDELIRQDKCRLYSVHLNNLNDCFNFRQVLSGYLGLAVDQHGHVYISGHCTNNIHRFSPDRILDTVHDIVLNEHDGVDKPFGITFNKDFTKLFIINGGKTVLVHRCR